MSILYQSEWLYWIKWRASRRTTISCVRNCICLNEGAQRQGICHCLGIQLVMCQKGHPIIIALVLGSSSTWTIAHCKGWDWKQVGRQANHTLSDSGLGHTDFKKSKASKCCLTLHDATCLLWQSVFTNDLHSFPKAGVRKVAWQKRTYCTGYSWKGRDSI